MPQEMINRPPAAEGSSMRTVKVLGAVVVLGNLIRDFL
jgi:hypothetical protein